MKEQHDTIIQACAERKHFCFYESYLNRDFVHLLPLGNYRYYIACPTAAAASQYQVSHPNVTTSRWWVTWEEASQN